MAAKRQWSDLSGRTRGLLIAAAVVGARRVNTMLPLLEATLDAFGGIGRSKRMAPRSRAGGPQPGATSASLPELPATRSP